MFAPFRVVDTKVMDENMAAASDALEYIQDVLELLRDEPNNPELDNTLDLEFPETYQDLGESAELTY